MKRFILLFAIVTQFFNYGLAQKGNCKVEMGNAFEYIIQKYVHYTYSELNNDTSNLFFVVSEISFDSVNCTFSLHLISEYDFDIIVSFIGKEYFILDSSVVILNDISSGLVHLIKNKKFVIKRESIDMFANKSKSHKYLLMANDDYGIDVKYDPQFKRIISYNTGASVPIFIFNDYNK